MLHWVQVPQEAKERRTFVPGGMSVMEVPVWRTIPAPVVDQLSGTASARYQEAA